MNDDEQSNELILTFQQLLKNLGERPRITTDNGSADALSASAAEPARFSTSHGSQKSCNLAHFQFPQLNYTLPPSGTFGILWGEFLRTSEPC